MSAKILWYLHNDEWVQVYRDDGRYWFVDTVTYGRKQVWAANAANVFEKKPTRTPVKGLTDRLGIKTKREITIKYTGERERTWLCDIHFDSDDWEPIQYGGDDTIITITETVTEISGWENTHVCGWYEEHSVTPGETDIEMITCECGKTGCFVTMDYFIQERRVDTIPVLGEVKEVTCNGRR